MNFNLLTTNRSSPFLALAAFIGLSVLSLPQIVFAAVPPPIYINPPTGGNAPAHVDAPGLYPLQATSSSVTVKWYDRCCAAGSETETGFNVFRRNAAGAWQLIYQTATRHQAGSGSGTNDYAFVDISTDLSGQCYMVTAYNSAAASNSLEECTVRPDPSRFPQSVASAAPQWSGLSNINDGTGILENINLGEQLFSEQQTFGVNLGWGYDSLWKIEAQGGPELMKGQAVALKVWNGGWLKHGEEAFGLDLQLSSTPVYEWYAIGYPGDSTESTYAGTPITDGGFALWNSSAQAYLVHGYELYGITLKWYTPSSGGGGTQTTHGVKTEEVFNCSIDQQTVELFIKDQTLGGTFVDKGPVNSQYSTGGCPAFGTTPYAFTPISGHQYLLVATDRSLSGCDGTDDPTQGACAAMTVAFLGDKGGVTRIDTVGSNTVIIP